jgi:hypothetical protein
VNRPPNRHEVELLDALVIMARPAILAVFSTDSCIASTRIGLDVLAYFGITGQPLPVRLVATNPAATTLVTVGTEPTGEPTRPAAPGRMVLGTSTGQWNPGHLAIAIPTLQVLIDLSLDQASRPAYGLTLRPAWWHIPQAEFWNDTNPQITLARADGVTLTYHRYPQEREFAQSPNWRRTSSNTPRGPAVFRQITAAIIRGMKAGASSGSGDLQQR